MSETVDEWIDSVKGLALDPAVAADCRQRLNESGRNQEMARYQKGSIGNNWDKDQDTCDQTARVTTRTPSTDAELIARYQFFIEQNSPLVAAHLLEMLLSRGVTVIGAH